MTVSLRLNSADSELIKAYAQIKGLTVSELLRQSVIERIEDEFDLQAYDSALKAYEADPVTYSMDEVKKELGI